MLILDNTHWNGSPEKKYTLAGLPAAILQDVTADIVVDQCSKQLTVG